MLNWRGLLVERGEVKVSIGRVLVWICLACLLISWTRGLEAPETLVQTFWLLLAYNLGKKVTGPLQSYWEAKGRMVAAPPQALPQPAPTKTISDPFGEEDVIEPRED